MTVPIHGLSGESRLAGSVETVIYHNEQNGYTVMKVVPEKARREDWVTVVGSLPTVNPGEDIQARGEWVRDPVHGRQFRAREIAAFTPKSIGGIERFLGGGLIDGIGREYASRIVKKFGTGVFEVLDQASQRLEEVEGIGPKRRRQIRESWQRQRGVRDVMVFLHSQGISTARALRIYKTYQEDAVRILRENPYQLARDIAGVGFRTADAIARGMGQEPESPARIAAGLAWVLDTAAEQGHCALLRAELVERAEKALEIGPGLVEPVLDRLIREASLEMDQCGGETLIFLPELRAAEIKAAEILRRLVQLPSEYPEIDVEKALAWCERETGQVLGGEQRQAVAASLHSRVLVITGGPGVGKTTILNTVLRILGAKKVRSLLCAPTGRAAKRLSESTGHEAVTLHRLLEGEPRGGFKKNLEHPLQGDLVVVDEGSMIDIHLFAALLAALPRNGHLLLVGDSDQLPSVGPGSVLRDIIDSSLVPVFRLTQIYRQAGQSRIIRAAHAINGGHVPDFPRQAAPGEREDYFFLPRDDPPAILDTLVGLVRDRLPRKYGFDAARDIQVLTPMNRNLLGTKNLNQVLQEALNPPGEWKYEIERFGVTFRTGDKVIQTRNNYDHEVFNGDIGWIREISTDPLKIKVVFDGLREVAYEPGELDELQLAYAITIHKSQGSEFACAVIPVSTQHYVMLQRNLFYTGVTRGKKLVVLVGEEKALALAVKTADSQKRRTGLRARLVLG
ncbi:MAG: ATP-dependent RecD-like DNA helicase [Verrucomicrobiales bacterium]|nr:ATP-dependent RecD-like DNA helicase [Verrucomicrobiales bacterium]